MSLLGRLRRLDEAAIPSLRQPGEAAELYLRRVATFYRVRNNDLGRALNEHFRQLDAERRERQQG